MGLLGIWDLKKGQCTRTVEVNEADVRAGAFSPDQRFFLTGDNDTLLRIWSVDNRRVPERVSGACTRNQRGGVLV